MKTLAFNPECRIHIGEAGGCIGRRYFFCEQIYSLAIS
jgi:hypothetical protein